MQNNTLKELKEIMHNALIEAFYFIKSVIPKPTKYTKYRLIITFKPAMKKYLDRCLYCDEGFLIVLQFYDGFRFVIYQTENDFYSFEKDRLSEIIFENDEKTRLKKCAAGYLNYLLCKRRIRIDAQNITVLC